jgi:hypothetical protein
MESGMSSKSSPLRSFMRDSAGPLGPETRIPAAQTNPFVPADFERVLRKNGWLAGEISPEVAEWLVHACTLLGPQAGHSAPFEESCDMLESLLRLIFIYDASNILADSDTHIVMVREGAREIIRELANRILAGSEVDSNHFREIIDEMKASLGFQGRKLFHPIRLALCGRAGEGELDRVILLLDPASKLPFSTPVKGTKQRVIEFCAALE